MNDYTILVNEKDNEVLIGVSASEDEFTIQVVQAEANLFRLEFIETGLMFADPVNAQEIVNKLESLEGDGRLSLNAIKGVPELAEKVQFFEATIEDFDCGRF